MISLCLLNYRYDSLSHFPTYALSQLKSLISVLFTSRNVYFDFQGKFCFKNAMANFSTSTFEVQNMDKYEF